MASSYPGPRPDRRAPGSDDEAAEENFHGYFRAGGTTPEDRRYGLTNSSSGAGWESVDSRFDATRPGNANEPNRFGWIVELDPFAPDEPPVKHTALGRLKHEGANVIVGSSGHVAAYMGDDERFDYLYKFVSSNKYRRGTRPVDRQRNKQLLTAGSLYVARFTGDSPAAQITGTGRCRPTGRSTAAANGYRSWWTGPARSPDSPPNRL